MSFNIPIAREGYRKIVSLLILTLVLALFELKILAVLSFVLSLIVINFYRDPERTPESPEGMVSPADGEVIEIEELNDQETFGGLCRKLTIFMRIYDVHVNRMPINGVIQKIQEKGEAYYPADQKRAGELNRSRTYLIETEEGEKIVLRQIAGLVARQIVSYVKPGDSVKRGERMGMIQFGSRVELYVPVHYQPAVQLHQKVYAGKSIVFR